MGQGRLWPAGRWHSRSTPRFGISRAFPHSPFVPDAVELSWSDVDCFTPLKLSVHLHAAQSRSKKNTRLSRSTHHGLSPRRLTRTRVLQSRAMLSKAKTRLIGNCSLHCFTPGQISCARRQESRGFPRSNGWPVAPVMRSRSELQIASRHLPTLKRRVTPSPTRTKRSEMAPGQALWPPPGARQ